MLIKTLQGRQPDNEKPTVESTPVQKEEESVDSLFCRSLIPILGNLTTQKNRYAKSKRYFIKLSLMILCDLIL